jgi:esterase
MKEDLREFMDAQQLEKAILLGHSMGGKTAMLFAACYPERVEAMIIVDIAPIAYHDLALTSHIAANHTKMMDAMMELDLENMESREEASNALAQKIGSERIRLFLLKNLTRDQEKKFTWKINLPVLKENLHGIMDGLNLEERMGTGGITGFPVLFLSGADSDYIRPENHAGIKSIFPTAEIVSIPNSGHWVHAEQSDLFLKTVNYFLDTD